MTDFGPFILEVAVIAGLVLSAIIVLSLILVLVGRSYEPKNSTPISDDEFMERLPPGTDREIALRVRAIVAHQTGVKREYIHPGTKFVDL